AAPIFYEWVERSSDRWETIRRVIDQTLLERGFVNETVFPGIPITYMDSLLKRYMQEHQDADLEYQGDLHYLRLRTADVVQRMEHLLEPIIQSITNRMLLEQRNNLRDQIDELLRNFISSIGLKVISIQDHKDFFTYLID